MKVRLLIPLVLACATLVMIGIPITSAYSTQQEVLQSAQRKIAPWVIGHTEDGKDAEFLVILADLSGVTAIDAGFYHSLALKSDGTVAGD